MARQIVNLQIIPQKAEEIAFNKPVVLKLGSNFKINPSTVIKSRRRMLTSDDCKTGGPNVLGILNWKTKFRNRTLSRGDALKASWREKPFDGSGRIPEI